MSLRSATPADYAAIRAIYGQYIPTPITFEYTLPSEEAFGRRMAAIQRLYPCLVAEEGGRMTGYAYAHCPWERRAYQWNAELSVYVDKKACHQGVGTQLYAAMLKLLALQGVRVALGCVTVPNAASEALHHKFGFREVARFEKAGFKNNAWHDVVWFSLPLVEDTSAPAELLSPADLPSPAELLSMEQLREIHPESGFRG